VVERIQGILLINISNANYIAYPRSVGIAWSIDGNLAVFCSGQYDPRKRDINNRKIKNYKELINFITNATAPKDESQYEDFGVETSRPNQLTTNLKNASTILGITQFQKRTYEMDRVRKYPQLFIKKELITKRVSKKESTNKKKSSISIYIPSEKIANEKHLAKEYEVVKDNAYKACLINASTCLNFDRFELYKAWSFLGCSLKDLCENKQEPKEWQESPLGKQAFLDLVSYFLE